MRKLLLALSLLCLTSVLHAEYLGLPNGRTADLTRLPDLSLELGYAGGNLSNSNYQNIGLRVNYRLSPGLILLGDLGLSEIGSINGQTLDDTAMGVGVFYSLDGLFENLDAVVKASYHMADFGYGFDYDILSLEFLISGLSPISHNGMMWYANSGVHRSDIGDLDSTEIGLGAGLVIPVSRGEAYVDLDLLSELNFGIGYRYFFE